MNYRRITSRIAQELKLPEIYTFLCLAMKSDYETMVSHINQDSLAEYADVNTRTVQRHLSKIEEKKLVTVEKIKRKNPDGKPFLKNKYSLSTEHYVLIDSCLTDEQISRELKAFLVVLKTLCVNNTNTCNFTIQEIADRTTMSKTTVSRYLNEALDNGYIKWDRDKHHIQLLNDKIFIVTQKSDIASAREKMNFEMARMRQNKELKDESLNNNNKSIRL